MRSHFTAATLGRITPSPVRQEIPDTLLPGLYFVVQPSGARSWAVRYRSDGKPRKFTLGAFPKIGLAEGPGPEACERERPAGPYYS